MQGELKYHTFIVAVFLYNNSDKLALSNIENFVTLAENFQGS